MNEEIKNKLWKIANSHCGKSEYFLKPVHGNKLDSKCIFPASYASYALELGSGWGEVAIELAKQNPETGYILMEKNVARVRSTIREIKKYNIQNIRFLTMNFNWFLSELFHPEFFSVIILNFPDPWPKKKHFKHRTLNQGFLDSLFYLLKKEGKFLFATDHGPYGRTGIRLFRKDKRFYFTSAEYNFKRDNFPVSHFELEKKRECKRIYYLERVKN